MNLWPYTPIFGGNRNLSSSYRLFHKIPSDPAHFQCRRFITTKRNILTKRPLRPALARVAWEREKRNSLRASLVRRYEEEERTRWTRKLLQLEESIHGYSPVGHDDRRARREEHKRAGNEAQCGIFWDIENVRNDSHPPAIVIEAIRDFAQCRQTPVFQAYLSHPHLNTRTNAIYAQLGVTFIQCYDLGKDTADKKIISDMWKFYASLQKSSPSSRIRIILITGDRDFAEAIGQLRNLGVEVGILTGSTVNSAPVYDDYTLGMRVLPFSGVIEAQARARDNNLDAYQSPKRKALEKFEESTPDDFVDEERNDLIEKTSPEKSVENVPDRKVTKPKTAPAKEPIIVEITPQISTAKQIPAETSSTKELPFRETGLQKEINGTESRSSEMAIPSASKPSDPVKQESESTDNSNSGGVFSRFKNIFASLTTSTSSVPKESSSSALSAYATISANIPTPPAANPSPNPSPSDVSTEKGPASAKFRTTPLQTDKPISTAHPIAETKPTKETLTDPVQSPIKCLPFSKYPSTRRLTKPIPERKSIFSAESLLHPLPVSKASSPGKLRTRSRTEGPLAWLPSSTSAGPSTLIQHYTAEILKAKPTDLCESDMRNIWNAWVKLETWSQGTLDEYVMRNLAKGALAKAVEIVELRKLEREQNEEEKVEIEKIVSTEFNDSETGEYRLIEEELKHESNKTGSQKAPEVTGGLYTETYATISSSDSTTTDPENEGKCGVGSSTKTETAIPLLSLT